MNLLEETKYIMKKYNISASKRFGQNFLIDDEIVSEIVSVSDITKDDLVIEIGPGLGTLTEKLLEKSGKVICIEIDKRMIDILEDRFKLYDNFEMIQGDILKIDLAEIINKNVGSHICDRNEAHKSSSQFTILHYNTNYYETIRRQT